MFSLPRDECSTVADWIELELALNAEINSVSKATLSSVIEQQLGNSADENLMTDVWRLLERRAELYRAPPFRVEGNLIHRVVDAEVSDVYIACLFFSLYGVRNKRSDPKILERIAAICITKYLGSGDSYVFGWPPTDGAPAPIGPRIAVVAGKMREKLAEYPAKNYKDRGVDVISWKPFEENGDEHRSGQIAILSQCAAGHDWAKKKGDVPLDAWKQYIHWANAPIRGFVVPGIVQDENWHDMSVDSGLVFDRVRICNYLPDPFPNPALLENIKTWIASEVDEARS